MKDKYVNTMIQILEVLLPLASHICSTVCRHRGVSVHVMDYDKVSAGVRVRGEGHG